MLCQSKVAGTLFRAAKPELDLGAAKLLFQLKHDTMINIHGISGCSCACAPFELSHAVSFRGGLIFKFKTAPKVRHLRQHHDSAAIMQTHAMPTR